jgi:tRNA threonylcarbamoyladenosine biosynthesis protein TsaE
LLIGELGAGKTTFVQGIAKGLKIKDRILSPTFVLVRNHAVDFNNIKNLNHVDLYRIEKPQDLESLGIEEFVSGKDSVTIIEWADRLLSFRPEKGYKINFNYLGNDQREILIDEI